MKCTLDIKSKTLAAQQTLNDCVGQIQPTEITYCNTTSKFFIKNTKSPFCSPSDVSKQKSRDHVNNRNNNLNSQLSGIGLFLTDTEIDITKIMDLFISGYI